MRACLGMRNDWRVNDHVFDNFIGPYALSMSIFLYKPIQIISISNLNRFKHIRSQCPYPILRKIICLRKDLGDKNKGKMNFLPAILS